MEEIIAIDGHSILFRYAFGIPEFFNSNGVQVNGIYGFCRLIVRLLKEGKVILIAFDKCPNNFRKKILPEYKKNRTRDLSHILFQIELAIEFCKISNLRYYFHPEYEADDIIATYTKTYSQNKFTIISTDKDLFQLIDKDNRIGVFNPFSKKRYLYQDIYTRYGIYAEDFDKFLALCGDASDNIPGIKGIGPKTAVKIINSNQYNHIDLIELEKMLSLTTLCKNVPLDDFNIKNLEFNKTEAKLFCEEMLFYSLLKDL